MELYANPNRQDHIDNNECFRQIVSDYIWLEKLLYRPSPVKAPWHWQAVITGNHYDQMVNFWPHVLKGQRNGFTSVQGEDAIRAIIEEALDDAYEEHFDVIED